MYLDMCTYKVDFVFCQQKVWVVCLEHSDFKEKNRLIQQ